MHLSSCRFWSKYPLLIVTFMMFAFVLFHFDFKTNFYLYLKTIVGNVYFAKLETDPLRWYSVPSNPNAGDLNAILVSETAYYDFRVNKVVALVASNYENQSEHSFLCVLFFDKKINFKKNSFLVTEGYFFTKYVFHCTLTDENFNNPKIPKMLTIQRSDNFTLPYIDWSIHVVDLFERKNRTTPIGSFAMIVGIMFGFQDWLTLLQYIEFHRIQGVEKFYFFYSDLHRSSEEIFRWYKAKFKNLLEIIHWNPPNHPKCGGNYRCQELRNNIYVYSLMYKYKYVGITDFDELLFPLGVNLTYLLKIIDKSDRGSFVFRGQYFLPLKQKTPEWRSVNVENVTHVIRKFLPIFRSNYATTFTPYNFAAKSVVKPETVLDFRTHRVEVHTNGTSMYHVDESREGFMRHFKKRNWWTKDTIRYMKMLNVTCSRINSKAEIAQPLFELLLENVISAVMRIKLFNNYKDM